MRLPKTEHTSRPWRIHEIAHDFRLEDVWALPAKGGPGDFPRLLEVVTSYDAERSGSKATRALFALRWKIGALLGLDRPSTGLGKRVPTLRDRLPYYLRDSMKHLNTGTLPFEPLYETDDEWALEMANETVHGVMHLSWVPDGEGGYRGQMAVLVKPNGLLGEAYMLAIKPFRYAIVYPKMMADLKREWGRAGQPVMA